MRIGTNIRQLRESRGLTQEELADRLNVSPQAVSAWERDSCKPDTKNLINLAHVLEVSLSAVGEGKTRHFETADTIFDWKHMKTHIKTAAKENNMPNAYKAVDFAVKAHAEQTRKRSDVPYIYHPLNLACHALAMGIKDDEVIAACLLHDVVEDCGITAEALPVTERIQEIVLLLSHMDAPGEDKTAARKHYYSRIAEHPKAALVKCIDRCNNLTTMSWGFTREKIFRYITETETYYPELLRIIKNEPAFSNAAWLLKYQMESMLDIYKRLM